MTRAFILSIACLAAAWGRPLASQAPQVRTATLLWQVDGSESGEPFGVLRDMLLHRDGSIWALDSKWQRILMAEPLKGSRVHVEEVLANSPTAADLVRNLRA